METRIVCPLGSTCETAKEGYVERCAWYTKLIGKDPQSKEDIDEWGCAMSWMPIMMVENAQMTRGTRSVLEEVRDESKTFNQILNSASQKALK